MPWPFLTRRAAAMSEESARALAYTEGVEAGRAEAIKDLLALHLRLAQLEHLLKTIQSAGKDAPDCDKCDRIAPDDIAEAVAEARTP